MPVWKNRVAADPTLEEDQTQEDKSKRPKKSEKKTRSTPAQYTRCWACWVRLPVSEDDEPDKVIETHRKSTCSKG